SSFVLSTFKIIKNHLNHVKFIIRAAKKKTKKK
ncbi:synapsin-1-like, partial [Arapaima gigas]